MPYKVNIFIVLDEKANMTRRNKIITHAAFWLLSTAVSVYAWNLPFYLPGHLGAWMLSTGLSTLSVMTYFYINYFLLIPYFFVRKKYIAFTVGAVINILTHICLCVFLWYNYTFTPEALSASALAPMTYECFFYGTISVGFTLAERWKTSEQRKRLLEKELKETELLFLQSQMSPHFLFNTLNNIYGLSLNNSPKTSIAVSQLKDLMHYFQYFEKAQKIVLANEIEYMEGYIALQSLRNAVHIDFEKKLTEGAEKLLIEPMLLLPFIENAFKHGELNKGIFIVLQVHDRQLDFTVRNHSNPRKRKDAVGGIGILNIERRLELLYPHQYQLEKNEDNGVFNLHLRINVL